MGKSFSPLGLPNVLNGNVVNNGGMDKTSIRPVTGLFEESEADLLFEVAVICFVASMVLWGVAAGLGGQASAGEERAELQSLLSMETAWFSVNVSSFNLLMVAEKGCKESGIVVCWQSLVMLPLSFSSMMASSMEHSLASASVL